jgi:hypothetical protein
MGTYSNAIIEGVKDVSCETNGNFILEVIREYTVSGIASHTAVEALVAVYENAIVPWGSYGLVLGALSFADLRAVGFSVEMGLNAAKVFARFINPTIVNIIGSASLELCETDKNIYGHQILTSNNGLPKKPVWSKADLDDANVPKWGAGGASDVLINTGTYQGGFPVGSFLLEMIRPNGAATAMGGPPWGTFPLLAAPANAVDPNVIRDTYVGTYNSGTFLGRAAGAVSCEAVEVDNTGLGNIANVLRFRFAVRYPPRKWTEVVSWQDPKTHVIPYCPQANFGPLDDVTAGTGTENPTYNNPPKQRFEVSSRKPIDMTKIFTTSMVP